MYKAEKLKSVVLENGWQVLSQKGRDALRLRDLATRSGCSVGTVYNLFENLDEIVLLLNVRCLDKMYSLLHEEMEKGLQENATIRVIFKRLGLAYIHFGTQNPWMWKTLFENLAIDPLPDWYRNKVQNGLQVIEEAMQKKFGIKQEDAHRIVNFFWAAMHGITSILLNKKMDVVGEDAHDAYISTYIDHCLRGFIP